MRWMLALCLSCGPGQPLNHLAPSMPDAPSASFPLTRGEQHGETYLYDPIIDVSRPCAPKAPPIELRLYTTDINHVTLRLSAKNCTTREIRFLHDAQLQPSQLVLSSGGKSLTFTDQRRSEKFDNTIHTAAFATLAPGEERVLDEGYFVLDDKGSRIHWQSFDAAVPRGTWTAQIRFTSAVAAGIEGKVAGVWLGTTTSNAVTVHTP